MKKSSILTIFTTFIILGLNAQIINIPADYPTIQQGIDASSDGDTVLVQPGTYQENIDFQGKAITIGSLLLTTNDTSYITQTIIDGGGNAATVSFLNNETNASVLKGFTISNGWCGILIEGNYGPTLQYLLVKDNLNYYDASGINSTCSGSQRNVIVDNCIFEYNALAKGVLSVCNINNTDTNSYYSITNSIFRFNEVTSAVIISDGESGKIDNVLIHDNIGKGIGIMNAEYYRSITNSTIVNNTDIGIYILYNNVHGSTVNIQNCIIWGNGNYQVGVITLTPMTIFNIGNSCIMNGIDGILVQPTTQLNWNNNISTNPLFINEDTFDFSLSDCSPAIGTGEIVYASTHDLNGNDRPQPSGSNPDIGAYENALGVSLIPPSITSQPIGTEICENGSYTLSIEADGSPVLYYQWQMDNVDLDGETNSYLILNNLTQANEGNYRCLVSNSCETISSNNVFINVLASPSVTQQPTDKYVYVGNGISFETTVTGDEPLSYQWYGPSGILTGDTLDYLLLTNINYSDTGYYYCSITNTCGTENTNNALLTVYDQLTVDAGNDLSIPIGTDTILNGSFQGGSPSIGYYWTPDSLLINPNVLNPQTLNLFEAHTFTLNVFDSIVDYQASDNMLITVVENDTLNYNTFESDTIYEYNVTRSNCGYVAGNNCDNDLIKAQYFYDDVKLFEINEILLHFGKAIKTSEEEIPIKIGIWDNTGGDNNPGTILTSAYIPLSDIVEDVKNERLSSLVLTESIKVSNGFYIGVFLPETEGDTVVLFTNKDGESQPNLSWTQKNGYEWSSYSQDPRWYLNVSNAIFPIVKQINLSINNITASENEYLVYPNPASNRVIIEVQKQTSGDAELMLLDLQGRVLEQKKFTNSTKLHLQNLNPGIYLLSIIKSNGNEVHKIIIQ